MSISALPGGRRGRMLAVAFLALFLGVLWLGLIAPLWELYAFRAERLAMREALAERMAEQSGASAPMLVPIDGDSDAMAAAGLQDLVRARADGLGLQVAQVETLAPEPLGEFVKVGLRIDVECSYADCARLLADLRDAPVTLVVDGLALEAGEAGVMQGTISVHAYRPAASGGTP